MDYYSYPRIDDGFYQGLLRSDGETVERADPAEGWVEDRRLLGRIVDPGGDGPERVTLAVARELADRYGVAL